jgi:hypothetical protein
MGYRRNVSRSQSTFHSMSFRQTIADGPSGLTVVLSLPLFTISFGHLNVVSLRALDVHYQ